MIRSDENRQYIPGIASDWEVSGDGSTWTFTIRDDALFHDGTPVTAADVEFSWLQVWGPGALEVATSATAINNAKNTEKIEQIGANQVSLTHGDVNSGFPNLMSGATCSCHGLVLPNIFGTALTFMM